MKRIVNFFSKLIQINVVIIAFSIALWAMISFVNWELMYISFNDILATARALFAVSIFYVLIWNYLGDD